MRKSEIPPADSIHELAEIWDTHDFTDFEDEMEEVTEAVFETEPIAEDSEATEYNKT